MIHQLRKVLGILAFLSITSLAPSCTDTKDPGEENVGRKETDNIPGGVIRTDSPLDSMPQDNTSVAGQTTVDSTKNGQPIRPRSQSNF